MNKFSGDCGHYNEVKWIVLPTTLIDGKTDMYRVAFTLKCLVSMQTRMYPRERIFLRTFRLSIYISGVFLPGAPIAPSLLIFGKCTGPASVTVPLALRKLVAR